MLAHLLIPKNAEPPYQTIVYFPGDAAFGLGWEHPGFETSYSPYLRSGRAVMFPVFKGMFDRKTERWRGPSEYRDRVIEWTKDLRRSIDYLESRDDIDEKKLAFIGNSRGANLAAIFTAVETRFAASLMTGGSLWAQAPPEIDAFHFASRVRVPTLISHGRFDFGTPVETEIQPLFDELGVPDGDKRLKLFESGHITPRLERLKEELAWLERYLGPVTLLRR